VFKQDAAAKLARKRSALLQCLRKTPFGLDVDLAHSVPSGVAYHHAGLTIDERTVVEKAFREGTLCVLAATSTLAAGVNLPARRVVFRCMKMGIENLDTAHYRQMAGRAGRAGKDTAGESYLSYLITLKAKLALVRRLVTEALPPLRSCLSLVRPCSARSSRVPFFFLVEVRVGMGGGRTRWASRAS